MLLRSGCTRTKFFIPRVQCLASVKGILFILDLVFKHCNQDMAGCRRVCKSEQTSHLQRYITTTHAYLFSVNLLIWPSNFFVCRLSHDQRGLSTLSRMNPIVTTMDFSKPQNYTVNGNWNRCNFLVL
jgi:1,4-alpha-glucan branching enzyme